MLENLYCALSQNYRMTSRSKTIHRPVFWSKQITGRFSVKANHRLIQKEPPPQILRYKLPLGVMLER